MTDTIEKLLFVVVGFIFGICANMIVDMWRARQRRTGLLKVMRAEARAFVVTCRSAEKSQLPTATDARHLAELIRERYSKDPERWTACRSRASQDAVAAFYLDCTGLLDAMSRYDQRHLANRFNLAFDAVKCWRYRQRSRLRVYRKQIKSCARTRHPHRAARCASRGAAPGQPTKTHAPRAWGYCGR
jgi:hypothetical protein